MPAVRPDIEVGDVDAVCRGLITEEGYGDAFGHATGHGVGLDIHELPTVRSGSTAILQPGQVITVEPGIYLPGIGGVRVEDMVVVTDDGCRSLTQYPKEPLCPPSPPTPLKNGMTLEFVDGLFQVVDFQHVKPGKGHAFVRANLRNVRAGGTVERTFRAGEKVERVTIDKREMNFLYRDGDGYVFMDNETYDQLHVPPDVLGAAGNYIVDGSTAVLLMFGDEIVGTDMAAAVELTIAGTEPGVQGDRSSGGTKPATLETGLVIQVPLFIDTGERVRIDTRTGEYISRA